MIGRTTIQQGTLPTICRQCDMRCGIKVHVNSGRVTGISGDPLHPQNRGLICPKGRAVVDTVYHKDRIIKPLKRLKDGRFAAISHDQAVEEITGIPSSLVERTAQLLAERRPRISSHVGASLEQQTNGVNTLRAVVCTGGLCGAVDAEGGDLWPESPAARSLRPAGELASSHNRPIGAKEFPLPCFFRRDGHTMTALQHIHPQDAARLGIEEAQRVRVVSESGSLEIQARVLKEGEILPGVVHIPYGFRRDDNVNLVTLDQVTDPLSGFPLLKSVPVRIEAAADS